METNVHARNIAEFATALNRLAECLPAHLDALCEEVAAFAEDRRVNRPPVTDDGLAYAFRSLSEPVEQAMAEAIRNHPAEPEAEGFRRLLWQAILPIASAKTAELLASRVTLAETPAPLTGRSRIAYCRNARSDRAERRFAALLPDPTVTYCTDFNAVCQELLSERADYVILPVAGEDGPLNGVEKRMLDYGLCPVAYTKAAGNDREPAVTFCLFAAEPKAPPGATRAEVLAFCDDTRSLSPLIAAAVALGCGVADCVRLPGEENFQSVFRLVFDLGEKERAMERFSALRIYLLTSFPHHLVTGLTVVC